MQTILTRVFMNGNSQAVRIPQEFRLDASRVQISRNVDGDLVIRPLAEDRGAGLLQALQGWPDAVRQDFVAALEAGRSEQAAGQEREPL